MDKRVFIKKYEHFDVDENQIEAYFDTVKRYEDFAGKDIEETDVEDIKQYFKYLIEQNENTYNNVIHIARCFYYTNKKQEYIHMTKYFNSIGVLENIISRISLFESDEKKDNLLSELILPPFGTDSTELPKYTKDFMEKIEKYLPRRSCNKILAGNNHRIPKESFLKEKEFYMASESFEKYLFDKHQRKVAELQHHYDNNLVWFEQIITKEAIEYVSSNQEILSGIVKGDKLYVTKIPYDVNNFLSEKDETLKRYYACHCSFVRESILKETEEIPKEWCYCSAGFAKYPFEIILNQELDVKLLKTPLDGDFVCRFEIDLKNVDYK